MARIIPRLLRDDRTKLGATLLSSSSQAPSFPDLRVLDPRRSKIWQSLPGWNVNAGVNDSIDIVDPVDGTVVAVLDEVNFPTGAAYAAEWQTQINAVVTGTPYTVIYNAITNEITVARSSLTFSILWSSGANASTSVGLDGGFDVSTDDAGSGSYTSDNPVQLSGEFLAFDLITATQIQAAISLEDNLTSSGTIKIQGDTTSDFLSPSFEATLVGGDVNDLTKRLVFLDETLRHWRFLVEDRNNPAGFIQIGMVFLGPFETFERTFDLQVADGVDEMSNLTMADQGALFTDIKPQRETFQYRFREVSDADRAQWLAVRRDLRVGQHFFYGRDPLNFPITEMIYGFVQPPGIQVRYNRSFTSETAPPVRFWDIDFAFSEAVG